jgi:hypothetical protein
MRRAATPAGDGDRVRRPGLDAPRRTWPPPRRCWSRSAHAGGPARAPGLAKPSCSRRPGGRRARRAAALAAERLPDQAGAADVGGPGALETDRPGRGRAPGLWRRSPVPQRPDGENRLAIVLPGPGQAGAVRSQGQARPGDRAATTSRCWAGRRRRRGSWATRCTRELCDYDAWSGLRHRDADGWRDLEAYLADLAHGAERATGSAHPPPSRCATAARPPTA